MSLEGELAGDLFRRRDNGFPDNADVDINSGLLHPGMVTLENIQRLDDLARGNEAASALFGVDQALAAEIIQSLTNDESAHAEAVDQFVFGGKLFAAPELAGMNGVGQQIAQLLVEGDRTVPVQRSMFPQF